MSQEMVNNQFLQQWNTKNFYVRRSASDSEKQSPATELQFVSGKKKLLHCLRLLMHEMRKEIRAKVPRLLNKNQATRVQSKCGSEKPIGKDYPMFCCGFWIKNDFFPCSAIMIKY